MPHQALVSFPDMGEIQEVGRLIAADTGGFTGGKLHLFAEAGRYTLESSLQNGLKPHHHLLDLGCGALRNGYWLIRFLDSGCYFGIEPVERYVRIGLKHAVGPELAAEKNPRFDHGRNFDFSVFGVKFDFVVARSIFSHASADQIEVAMASFRENSSERAVMLSSYAPAPNRPAHAIADETPRDSRWATRAHSRLRRYSLDFLQTLATRYGLSVVDFGDRYNGQVWLRVTRAGV